MRLRHKILHKSTQYLSNPTNPARSRPTRISFMVCADTKQRRASSAPERGSSVSRALNAAYCGVVIPCAARPRSMTVRSACCARFSWYPTRSKSLDGQRVVNYAQWENREAFEAMLRNPDARPHMSRAAAIASFDPILCEVTHVDHGCEPCRISCSHPAAVRRALLRDWRAPLLDRCRVKGPREPWR